jgi:hypothetical protein
MLKNELFFIVSRRKGMMETRWVRGTKKATLAMETTRRRFPKRTPYLS